MIQDIHPHVFSNSYLGTARPVANNPVLHFAKGAPLVKIENSEVLLPSLESFSAETQPSMKLQYLFQIDEQSYFLCMDDEVCVPEGFAHTAIRDFRKHTTEPRHEVFALYTAFQLDSWYRDNRYCGSCGAPTTPAPDERAIDCTSCGRRIYPRVQPAVIIGVTHGNSLLITRYANRPHTAHALVAGFNEVGETLEETVQREVREETGLEVNNIRYYKSQPWGIASDVLSGFYCDVVGDSTPHANPDELKEAVWVEREAIVGQPDNFSLTNEMMLSFRDGREPR